MHPVVEYAKSFIRSSRLVGPAYLPFYMRRKAREAKGGERASFFFMPDKNPIAHAAVGYRPIAHLGYFSPRHFGVSELAMRREVVRLLEELGASELVVFGRRDRQFLGVDFESHCLNVARCEVAVLPNRFKGPARKFAGYVVDRGGPYYDGSVSTTLEIALNGLTSGWWRSDPDAVAFLSEFRSSDVTKYMSGPAHGADVPGPEDVLILGQCSGDHSVLYTSGQAKAILDLIEAVLGEGHGRTVIYRPHPKNPANDVELPLIRARFKDAVSIMGTAISFIQAIGNRPKVMTMTSGAGLEAAIRGCPVTCFSVAFYSNWGFTRDRTPCSRRTNRLTAEDVFLYFCTRHSRYFHPTIPGAEIAPLQALRGRL